MATVAVFTGGAAVRSEEAALAREADVVIAADRGYKLAVAAGCVVDLLVGDLDSLSAPTVERAAEAGVPIERHPIDKDQTDLELALTYACAVPGVNRIVVFGAAGGRFDHMLANIAVLTASAPAGVQVEAWVDGTHIFVVRDRVVFEGDRGDTLTLLAYGGPARGVTTSGLRWPLVDATLDPSSGLGVSNELVDSRVEVTVASGVLLVMHLPQASSNAG